jgi:cytochrome P450
MVYELPFSLMTVGTATFAVYLCYISGLLIYRLTIHPLAKYPGPLLAKITDWYDVYYAMKGNRYLEHWRCHERYGDYVRVAPNTLSVNTATGLKDIYGPRANARKSDWYNTLTSYPGVYSTHNCIPKDIHAKKRRILSYAFSEEAMRSMEQQMIDVIQTWLKALAVPEANGVEKLSGTKDMSAWTNYLSLDILGKLCFGESFDTITRADNRWVMAAMMHTIIVRYPVSLWH